MIGITHPQTCLVLRGRLRALREAGFAVTLISSPGTLLEELGQLDGIATVGIPMEREIAPLRDIVSLLRLRAVLRRIRPGVVEFSTPKAGLLGMVAAWSAGVPHRVYLLRGLKLETVSGWRRGVLWAAEWLASACAETVLCTSASVRDKAYALKIAPQGKLRVLGEGSSAGVDIERFRPGASDVRRRLGIEAGTRVLGFVGRLTRDKGLPDLVEALEVILCSQPNTYLLLVGWFDEAEDALDSSLRERIQAHPRIICTGFVDDTVPYYRAMDVMILPTMREGLPNAVLEASASGVAVITTLPTGSRDAVLPEVTGLLVATECPGAIAEGALQLLQDEELRQRMGTAGRAWVVAHFSRERVLGLNVAFYQQLSDTENTREAEAPCVSAPAGQTQ